VIADMTFQNPRTAQAQSSIWSSISENTFRQHLVVLQERTNAVPIDPEVFEISQWSQQNDHNHTLPIAIEQQLADDFARLVAVDEGAQSVSAVCIEESYEGKGLTLRFAALNVERNEAIKSTLETVSEIMLQVSTSEGRGTENPNVQLLDHIVRLHFLRLLARLRSSKWMKPKYLAKSHKKPLWQDFTNLHHRVGHLYAKKEKNLRLQVESIVLMLMNVYHEFETRSAENEHEHMMRIINVSYETLGSDLLKDLLRRLEGGVNVTPTNQVASAIKCLRQVEKIAGYRRICENLVSTALNYAQLFQNGLQYEYLIPYTNVPTEIGYESWAKTCHVHAEVQLVVYYDLVARQGAKQTQNMRFPRCIGISKWLCYLCYRFLEAHGTFFPSKTHGRLYDQWTVPDIAEYEDSIVTRYREVLQKMDDVVVRQAENEPELWRIEPMTSVDVVHTAAIEDEAAILLVDKWLKPKNA